MEFLSVCPEPAKTGHAVKSPWNYSIYPPHNRSPSDAKFLQRNPADSDKRDRVLWAQDSGHASSVVDQHMTAEQTSGYESSILDRQVKTEHSPGPISTGGEHCPICWEKDHSLRHFHNNAEKKYDQHLLIPLPVLTVNRKHFRAHTRPFKCDVTSCQNPGFSSNSDLKRHQKEKHCIQPSHGPVPWYRCAHKTCIQGNKAWPRKDNFKAHAERKHSNLSKTEIQALIER